MWGVGATHELSAVPLPAPDHVLALDFDVHAPLDGALNSQEVVVFVDGNEVARWNFSPNQNRSVRTINVQRSSTDASVLLKIEFKPRPLVTPAKINPTSYDTRELGMALHRLRVRRG